MRWDLFLLQVMNMRQEVTFHAAEWLRLHRSGHTLRAFRNELGRVDGVRLDGARAEAGGLEDRRVDMELCLGSGEAEEGGEITR